MLRKLIINVATMMVLGLTSQPLLAQNIDNATPPAHIIKQKIDQSQSPVNKLQRLLNHAALYENLLAYPKFIKLQDMARRVWEKQTGNKRRVLATSRPNIIALPPHPAHALHE